LGKLEIKQPLILFVLKKFPSIKQPLVFRFFRSWLKEPTSRFLEVTGSFREGLLDQFLDLLCGKCQNPPVKDGPAALSAIHTKVSHM
jgi:hypothetical protein